MRDPVLPRRRTPPFRLLRGASDSAPLELMHAAGLKGDGDGTITSREAVIQPDDQTLISASMRPNLAAPQGC